MLHGLMMDTPLLISSLIEHADRHHGDTEIVSRRVEGDLHRCAYSDLHRRARQMANALHTLGVGHGDRVATLAWNGYRHIELYFAVSGYGAVLHTINPRLHLDQAAWIVNHAGDTVLFFDVTFLPIIEALAPRCPSIRAWVAMTDRDRMPASSKVGLLCYEDLIDSSSDGYEWPRLDERQASALCYTSGTTGHPKGVLYSHRSTVLHSHAIALPDIFNLSACDTILPVVPMFHANAWGLNYAAAMVGLRLVLPGPQLDGKSLFDLFESERVTCTAGVPTVWQGLLAYMEANQLRFSTLRRTVIGGAAVPPAMLRLLQEKYHVEVLHAWGMTEMSPLGTLCHFKGKHVSLSRDAQLAIRESQGRAAYGVDMKIVGEDGGELAWDGKQCGELLVRGPWIAAEYFKSDAGDPLRDGWFPTGDVATIDADGYMRITDRSKDLIKSGGEWISSIELENIAMSHPSVAMAACIAVPHPKWDERPLLVIVRRPNADVTEADLLTHCAARVAKWQVPDGIAFVESIPVGPTGKMLKTKLRDQFKDYRPS
ncbi:MAG: 3-(methylthio)propionyl-CoA ligase [Vicinamibacterales bacterium]